MKIRNGFVSNSSSSNFIIKLDVIPTSEEHLAKILGVDGYDKLNMYGDYYDKKEIVNTIYEDINRELKYVGEKTKLQDIDLEGEIYIYDKDHVYDYEQFIESDKIEEYFMLCNKLLNTRNWGIKDQLNRDISWELSSILNEQILKLIKKGMSKDIDNNLKFIKLTYADEDGRVGSYIEHSGVLDPITFKKFNHH